MEHDMEAGLVGTCRTDLVFLLGTTKAKPYPSNIL